MRKAPVSSFLKGHAAEKTAGFQADHRYIVPGMCVSITDGDIVTYDLRTRRPNCGDYMDNVTMHSVEHMFATFARGGTLGKKRYTSVPWAAARDFIFSCAAAPTAKHTAM